MRKSLFLTVLMFYLLCFCAYAQDPYDIFIEANTAYADQEYRKAADKYAVLLDMGYAGAELCFNTGNAYAKLGNLPEAVLFYYRALGYSPNDPDILHNLKYILSNMTRSYEEPEYPFYIKLLSYLFGWLSQRSIPVCVLILNFLFFILLAVDRYANIKIQKWIFALTVILVFFLMIQYYTRSYMQKNLAVITEPEARVFYEPSENTTVHFVLQGGERVRIIKSDDFDADWIKIRRLDGPKGWVPASSIEKI